MPTGRDVRHPRIARAFAPGHVTGFFVPAVVGPDARTHGSRGAGLVLELGVHAVASWKSSTRSSVRVHGDTGGKWPISAEAARSLVALRPGRIEVELRHELPIGQGFGMSAAGSLATALSVGALVGASRSRSIEAAHLADLRGGGGLGGVAAILGGGLEIRERPGIPPWGRIAHRSFGGSIVVAVAGPPIPSPRLLGDPRFLERVAEVGKPAVSRIRRTPTRRSFLRDAERFTDDLHLAPPPLRRIIDDLRSTGAACAQAMFGNSLFAVAGSPRIRHALLDRASTMGLSGVVVRAAARGARVVSSTG